MPEDALILIGVAILLQLGLWFRVTHAIQAIERRLDGLTADYWLEEYEPDEHGVFGQERFAGEKENS